MAGVLSRLEILLHANTANFRRNMRRAADDAGNAMSDMKKKAAVVAKGMGIALAAVTGVAAGLAAALVPVQRQFDIMNGQLVTATGSAEGAAHAMAALNKFAAQTPYDLEQSVIGFTKLVNLGLNPSERAMLSYGNTASAMGKSMEQMIEAVADAATGEFERLKEFGIKASKEGDRVTFTFRGVKTEVGQNAAEIEKYLMDLGEVEFAGAMANQMDTLNGRISQAEIAMDGLKLAIAQSGIGDIMKEAVEATTARLEQLTNYIKGPEFGASLEILALSFDLFRTNAFSAINSVENKMGVGLGDINKANTSTLLNMANNWAEWSNIVVATISRTTVTTLGFLEKIIINGKAAADIAANPFNPFAIGDALIRRTAALQANAANVERLQNQIDRRFEENIERRIKINQEAAAATEALKNRTVEAGDQLERYRAKEVEGQAASAEGTKKQAAAEKALASQRAKDSRDRIRQLQNEIDFTRGSIDLIKNLAGRYDPFERIHYEFQNVLDDINKYIPPTSELNIKARAMYLEKEHALMDQADVEEQVRQERRAEEYSDHLTDKITRLKAYYDQEHRLAQSAFDLTDTQKEGAQKAINAAATRELNLYLGEIEDRLANIEAPFIDDMTMAIKNADAELRELRYNLDYDDETKARFDKAIKARADYELDQIVFVREKDLAMATDHLKTEMQLIKQRYDFERGEIRLTKNLTDEVRAAKNAAIDAKEADALNNLQLGAADNFAAMQSSLNGTDQNYQVAQTYNARKEIIQEALDAEVISVREAEKAKFDARQEFERAAMELSLQSGASIAGNMADSLETMMGKQNAAYKFMFGVQQSFVMASAGLNMYKAWGDAMAEGATLSQKLTAAATIVAEFGTIISAASSMKLNLSGYKSGGYTGDGGESEVAGLVHGKEFVTHAAATKKYRPELEAMNAGTYGKGSGGDNVSVNVTVHSDGKNSVEADQRAGREMGHAITAAIRKQLIKEKRQGGLLHA